jgi:hypothetical protein
MTDNKQNINALQTAQLLKIYQEFLKLVIEKLQDGNDEQLIASTLVAQGLRLYRGIFNDQQFKDMLESVNRDANAIKPLFEKKQPTTN